MRECIASCDGHLRLLVHLSYTDPANVDTCYRTSDIPHSLMPLPISSEKSSIGKLSVSQWQIQVFQSMNFSLESSDFTIGSKYCQLFSFEITSSLLPSGFKNSTKYPCFNNNSCWLFFILKKGVSRKSGQFSSQLSYSRVFPEDSLDMQQKCLMHTSFFLTLNVKKACIQRSGFNKINFYCLLKDILTQNFFFFSNGDEDYTRLVWFGVIVLFLVRHQ